MAGAWRDADCILASRGHWPRRPTPALPIGRGAGASGRSAQAREPLERSGTLADSATPESPAPDASPRRCLGKEGAAMSWATIGRLAGSLLVATMLCLAGARPVGAVASVEVTPTDDPAQFRFEARGFKDGEEVSTWLTGPADQVMATGVRDTDDRGRVSYRMRMPRHFQPGRWAITVHGLESDREAIGSFDLPLLGPDVGLTVNPARGPAGATFRFTSPDFDGGEIVSTWLTGPDGSVTDGERLDADGAGRIDFTYTAPAGAPSGTWAMSAYGWGSNHYGVATFVVG
jgi:hypothetical protein